MYHNVIRIRLRQQQRRVAVAQKAEITLKREVIHVTPISTHKRRHEQQQRRLRLMEVGYVAFTILNSYPGAMIMRVSPTSVDNPSRSRASTMQCNASAADSRG